MPVAIDPQAYHFARRIAAETGWRASDVYDTYMGFYLNEAYPRESIEAALALVADRRLGRESFHETVLRIGAICADLNRFATKGGKPS